MRHLVRWTKKEIATVSNDVAAWERGDITSTDLKAMYQGRSRAAICERARVLVLKGGRIPSRLNPVYAAVEARMLALGYGPEIIKSIISPRKVAISTQTIREIETQLSASAIGAGWFYFTVRNDGSVFVKPLIPHLDPSVIEAEAKIGQ